MDGYHRVRSKTDASSKLLRGILLALCFGLCSLCFYFLFLIETDVFCFANSSSYNPITISQYLSSDYKDVSANFSLLLGMYAGFLLVECLNHVI